MELRHLTYFVAVAEELHFGRAAERLQMAQPPLSRQICQLEKELGVQLLYRTRRKVALTAAGQLFLEEARLILRQTKHAAWVARRASRGEIGETVVGFCSSAMYGITSSILQTFRARYPDVRLMLRELTTLGQMQSLAEGRIDVGFLRPPVSSDSLISIEVIAREPLVVALPESHTLAKLSEVPLWRLADEPFVTYPTNLKEGPREHLMSLCHQAGFHPKIAQEAAQMETIINLVAAGLGVSLVPISLRNARMVGVAYRLIREPAGELELAVGWRNDNRSPVLKAFLGVVKEKTQVPISP